MDPNLLFPAYVEVNGVRISGELLPTIVALFTNPNPRMWFRFERIVGPEGDTIKVTRKEDESA